MRHRTFKDALGFVLCWPSTAGHGPFTVVWFPSETHLEKSKFSFANGINWVFASELGWGLVSTSPFSSRTPSSSDPVHTTPVSQLICPPALLYGENSFQLFFCRVSWAPKGGIWWRYPIGDWVFQGLVLSADWLALGLCICPICCRRKLLLWWLSKANIYSRISLGVSLLLCSFSRAVVFGFL